MFLTPASIYSITYTYFRDEIEARYAELRNKGVVDVEHIYSYIKDWNIRIGANMYSLEYDKWPDTPSFRDSGLNANYWERASGMLSGYQPYEATKPYSVGNEVFYGAVNKDNELVGYNLWRALDNIQGVTPGTDSTKSSLF